MQRPQFDPQREAAVRCEIVNDHEVDVTIPTSVLLQWVPDPSGDLETVYESRQFQAYMELRAQVQRSFDNRKKENAKSYQRYIERAVRGEAVGQMPQILAYSPWSLRTQMIELPAFRQSLSLIFIPRGMPMVALDGETQRLARQRAAVNVPEVASSMVSVRILHGVGVEFARQVAHDRNVLGVVASASDVINLDQNDIATKAANKLSLDSAVLRGRVQEDGRSLRGATAGRNDVIVISAVRTGVATAFLGTKAMKVGKRPLAELLHRAKISEQQAEEMLPLVVERWSEVLEHLRAPILERSPGETVLTSPSVFGAVGVLVNRTLPMPFRQEDPQLTMNQVLALLDGVRWEKSLADTTGARSYPWDGVAGKYSATGVFSVGGPGELGHRIVAALQHPGSPEGRQIRSAGATPILRSVSQPSLDKPGDGGFGQLTL